MNILYIQLYSLHKWTIGTCSVAKYLQINKKSIQYNFVPKNLFFLFEVYLFTIGLVV